MQIRSIRLISVSLLFFSLVAQNIEMHWELSAQRNQIVQEANNSIWLAQMIKTNADSIGHLAHAMNADSQAITEQSDTVNSLLMSMRALERRQDGVEMNFPPHPLVLPPSLQNNSAPDSKRVYAALCRW